MRSADQAVDGASAPRAPGRWVGGHASANMARGVAGGGLLAARLERRGGTHQISPAGEVSIRSPRGRDVLAVMPVSLIREEPTGQASRFGQSGRLGLDFLRSRSFFPNMYYMLRFDVPCKISNVKTKYGISYFKRLCTVLLW